MSFKRYQHVERIGHKEVQDLLFGRCHVFPKLDGANGSVWSQPATEGRGVTFHAGSRNRELALGDGDNHGFYAHVLEHEGLRALLGDYPRYRFHGEWLVPHTLKTYREDAWRQFYVFDVEAMEDVPEGIHAEDGSRTVLPRNHFLPFEDYADTLQRYGVNVVPPLAIIEHPTEADLHKLVEQNTYLIQDGCGVGEGIVVKRYGHVNHFGRVCWGKVVRNEFKEQNRLAFGTTERDGSFQVEVAIVQEFVTPTLVAKERAKLEQLDLDRRQLIPRLLQTVYYELIREETWAFLKKHKAPTINFRTLQRACEQQVKQLAKDLF